MDDFRRIYIDDWYDTIRIYYWTKMVSYRMIIFDSVFWNLYIYIYIWCNIFYSNITNSPSISKANTKYKETHYVVLSSLYILLILSPHEPSPILTTEKNTIIVTYIGESSKWFRIGMIHTTHIRTMVMETHRRNTNCICGYSYWVQYTVWHIYCTLLVVLLSNGYDEYGTYTYFKQIQSSECNGNNNFPELWKTVS